MSEQLHETEIQYPATGGRLATIAYKCAEIRLSGEPLGDDEEYGRVHYLPGRAMRDLPEAVAEIERAEAERAQWRLEQGLDVLLRQVTVQRRDLACVYVTCGNCGIAFGENDGDCEGLAHLDPLDAVDLLRACDWRQRAEDGCWVCPEDIDAQPVDEPAGADALALWDETCLSCGHLASGNARHQCSRAQAVALVRALLAVMFLIPAAALAFPFGEHVSAAIALWVGLNALALTISASTPRPARGVPFLRRVIRWCAK